MPRKVCAIFIIHILITGRVKNKVIFGTLSKGEGVFHITLVPIPKVKFKTAKKLSQKLHKNTFIFNQLFGQKPQLTMFLDKDRGYLLKDQVVESQIYYCQII